MFVMAVDYAQTSRRGAPLKSGPRPYSLAGSFSRLSLERGESSNFRCAYKYTIFNKTDFSKNKNRAKLAKRFARGFLKEKMTPKDPKQTFGFVLEIDLCAKHSFVAAIPSATGELLCPAVYLLVEAIKGNLDFSAMVSSSAQMLGLRDIRDEQLLKAARRSSGYYSTVQKMNARDKAGNTPFILACSDGRVEDVQLLSEVPEIDLNAVDNSGCSAFHRACTEYQDPGMQVFAQTTVVVQKAQRAQMWTTAVCYYKNC